MDAWKIALLIGIGLLLLVASLWLVHHRRSTWQRFARRKRLLYRETDAGPQAMGTVHGLPFTLAMAGDSSDTGALGVEEVRMSVELPCPVPEGVAIHRASRMEQVVAEVTMGEPFVTDDEPFDQQFLVETPDAEAARAYLTPARRKALLELSELPISCHAGLEGQQLFLQDREMVASLNRLSHHFAVLMRAARGLCQAEPATTVSSR
jgi:hypothetical protein